MKEIAVCGINGHVMADVLSALLHRGVTVNAYVNTPERLMDTSTQLTASVLRADNKDEMRESLEGYHDVILAFDDDLSNHDENTFVLTRYNDMVSAARAAGVSRLIVVGSPESVAFFTGDLKRRDDIDWVYVATEGDYASRVADEITDPRHHKEIFEDN